ncbi:MAG: hypothetical protein AAB420_03655 [Patescibacteria group bacterium]
MSQPLTKEDLKEAIAGLATKKDLESLKDELKLHMNARLEDVATKDDLLALETKFIKDVDAVVGVQVKDTKDFKGRVERLEGVVFPRKHA